MAKALDLCSWTLSTVLVRNGDYMMDVLTSLTTMDALMMMMLGYSANQVI